MSEEKSLTLFVSGMHCAACETLIEQEVAEQPGISSVHASLKSGQVTVRGEAIDKPSELAARLTERVRSHGYSISTEKVTTKSWHEFYYAIPIAAALIVLFMAVQMSGIVNFSAGPNVNFGTAFLIGLIASVSSCLAVVGGLTLSVAANYAHQGKRHRPHIAFHASRLIAFFILGGLLGILGSSFHLSFIASTALGITVAFVMIILGLNLLDVFNFTKRLQVRMPEKFSVSSSTQKKGLWGAAFTGAMTFFLPCGFTQSMQIYTLTTGSFWVGSMTMFVFALGTLPALAMLSFGSFSLANKKWAGTFFKTTGLIVIALAVYNLLNSVAVLGWIEPVFNF